jgi:SAM-dependent MidA family methyltransferase
LPFRLFVFDGAWLEAFVAQTPDGAFVEVLHKPSALPAVLPQTAALGSRVPIQDDASTWVNNALSLIERGSLLLFDYCSDTTAEVAAMPWREWLRTYKDHERGGHYLLAPGSQDITAQVVLDQLPTGFVAMTQAQFLQQWGIDQLPAGFNAIAQAKFLQLWGIEELVLEGKAYWEQLSGAPDVAAIKMRSRGTEQAELLDNYGLGKMIALDWKKQKN